MELQQRIIAFSSLGDRLDQFLGEPEAPEFQSLVAKAKAHNGWFTSNNVKKALQSWKDELRLENLKKWLEAYPSNFEPKTEKTVAIVMAGNIPLVGFHDFLSVLISGNKVLAKLSSNDKILLPFITEQLLIIEPAFKDYITYTDSRLENFDAVIATGSNNTARYFDYYFSKYPHIIRKNRNSVAVLTGDESKEDIEALANDIFMYFGLGCRNVSKILVPDNYNWDSFFNGMYDWKDVINNHKYMNNYDYNKAVYLMSDIKLLDNEFMLLKEDNGFSSPISVVFYEKYSDDKSIASYIEKERENIQCVVGKDYLPFGSTQQPALWDYADGIDTLQFLHSL